ncbi:MULTISPECIES: translation initiation factor [Psychroflexus]|uniref:Translation initiation factor 1 n=1 Tax=Psychroflexus halocasei TaxID=908615 RepID=A0A1H3WVK1_9FLAO|nr:MULTISPECIES: translation initiation factor [Psychroflexus]PJX20642.1 translation initiation factor SUI1-related protein [Psychroflexus sp. S27]SDZ90362.1 translation initiation factor 1 [Psychroflexus halocasei]
MDLKDQLKDLFPDHEPDSSEKEETNKDDELDIWLQEDPLLCKFEKRKGKANTIVDGYQGAKKDFKNLTKFLQKECGTGGSFKKEQIIIQGDSRDKVMELLNEIGFKTKRVGG